MNQYSKDTWEARADKILQQRGRERHSFPGEAKQRYPLIKNATWACLQGGDFPQRFCYKKWKAKKVIQEGKDRGVGVRTKALKCERNSDCLGLMRQCGNTEEEKTALSCVFSQFILCSAMRHRGSICLHYLHCNLPSGWHHLSLLQHRVIIDWPGRSTFQRCSWPSCVCSHLHTERESGNKEGMNTRFHNAYSRDSDKWGLIKPQSPPDAHKEHHFLSLSWHDFSFPFLLLSWAHLFSPYFSLDLIHRRSLLLDFGSGSSLWSIVDIILKLQRLLLCLYNCAKLS